MTAPELEWQLTQSENYCKYPEKIQKLRNLIHKKNKILKKLLKTNARYNNKKIVMDSNDSVAAESSVMFQSEELLRLDIKNIYDEAFALTVM
jgi:archaellum biogenesis ATPase FlaH